MQTEDFIIFLNFIAASKISTFRIQSYTRIIDTDKAELFQASQEPFCIGLLTFELESSFSSYTSPIKYVLLQIQWVGFQ